jgi:hypothetical protein
MGTADASIAARHGHYASRANKAPPYPRGVPVTTMVEAGGVDLKILESK